MNIFTENKIFSKKINIATENKIFSCYIYSEYQRKIQEYSQYQLDKKLFCLHNHTLVTNSIFHGLSNETNINKKGYHGVIEV